MSLSRYSSSNCIFCNKYIKYTEDFSYSTTKPFTYKGKKFHSKVLRFHMKCYRENLSAIKLDFQDVV